MQMGLLIFSILVAGFTLGGAARLIVPGSQRLSWSETLLIGVTDEGAAIGLDDDLKLMKEPDLDRYELWLTDHLERCVGKPAVANVTVTFELVDNSQVCRVDVEAAQGPVFLDEPGGNREVDMYVRMGNSTRKLLTDEAFEYARQRWQTRASCS